MGNSTFKAGIGTALTATGALLQTNDIIQLLAIIITIIGGLITVLTGLAGICNAIKKWYEKHKEKVAAAKDDAAKQEELKAERMKEFEELFNKVIQNGQVIKQGAEDIKGALERKDRGTF